MRVIPVVFVVLVIVSGCASTRLYEGQPRSGNEVVRITGMSGLDPLGGNISSLVCKFDGKDIDGCVVNIEFLPGLHRLELLTKRYGVVQGTRVVEQEFGAGERYLLGVGAYPGENKILPALIPQRRDN